MKKYIIALGLLTSASPLYAQDADRIKELQTQLDTLLKSAQDIQLEIDAMTQATVDETGETKKPSSNWSPIPAQTQVATVVDAKVSSKTAQIGEPAAISTRSADISKQAGGKGVANGNGQSDTQPTKGFTCAFASKETTLKAVSTNPWAVANCAVQGLDMVVKDQKEEQKRKERDGKESKRKHPFDYTLHAQFVDEPKFRRPSDVARLAPGYVGIAGGPLQPGGARATFTFGSGSEAEFTLTKPIYARNLIKIECNPKAIGVDRKTKFCPDRFAPRIFSISGSISTPILKGKNAIFFGGADDDDTTDRFDFTSKTSAKLGFDFLQFEETKVQDASSAMDKMLTEAVTACKKKPKDVAKGYCSRAKIINWVLEYKHDKTTPDGFAFVRRDLADKLANIPWRAQDKARPTWGLGGSIKYTNTEFDFKQATFNGGATSIDQIYDQEAESYNLNFLEPLVSGTRSTSNVELEVHGLFYINRLKDDRNHTPVGKLSGIMLIPQYTYQSAYDFLPGSTAQTCQFSPEAGQEPPLTVAALASCSNVQIDAPRRDQTHTISLEARNEFLNVPFFGRLGTAPKLSYRIDDNQIKAELPIYFLKEKELNSGFRLSYRTGGTNTLKIDAGDDWRLSIFFTPLTFTGFQ